MKHCNQCGKPIPAGREGWQCSEECRAKQKAYSQRPDVKARNRELDADRKLRREYQRLMLKAENKKNPIEKWEIRRLEAIAEFFGRDIEEWRTERLRKEQEELAR